MSNLKLGEYFDPESIETENKELHLYPHFLGNLTNDDIFNLVKTGKWLPELSTIIENNLLQFLTNIVPKYIACFANASIDGVINVGINDYNEITGIPIIGELTIKHKKNILDSIKATIQNNLDLDEPTRQLIIEKLQVEYINLEIDPEIISDDADQYFTSFSRDIIDYNDKMDDYLERHALFLKEHRKYTQKLDKMLNTTKYRLELAEFIFTNSPSPELTNHLVLELKGSSYITIEQENIYGDKQNRQRMFYWIAEFRKAKTTTIYKQKPIKPSHPSIYHPKQIVCNLPVMRAKLIRCNPNLQYYIIRIKCNVAEIHQTVKYRDPFSNRWLHRTRVDTQQLSGPGCI